MTKRLFDIVIAALGLILVSPLVLGAMLLVWAQDRRSPLYVADRVARGGGTFRMVKIRSMIAHADRLGASSTAGDDARVTGVGRFIRRWKVDELSQLWNVLKGDMSLVGPRPQVPAEVAIYTPEQRRLLSVRPGITDFASIVFSDEGEILRNSDDPDQLYRDIIWPWKSELGLLYVRHRHLSLDLRIIFITAIAIFDRRRALRMLQPVIDRLGASPRTMAAAARETDLRLLMQNGR
jgi:lipopolysaccharide/colanic/teichoic acid biosynthesis glycosyltransferase